MKKKINIGIIGKNFGLRVILKAFKKNKKLKIVALSSIKKPKKNLLEENSLYYFPNWKKMINSKLIDAVVVATPPNIQDQIVNYSIKKNKHIFCEKPFTESFQKAKKIRN
jgi:predicted dehydrogenase